MDRNTLNQRLPGFVDALVESIEAVPRLAHLNRVYLPSRDEIVKSIDLLRELVFPGFFGRQGLTSENLPYRVGELANALSEVLYEQVRFCLRYRQQIPGANGNSQECDECDRKAAEVVSAFLEKLPSVREMLSDDVQAAFDADPAARGTDETVFCYPGLYAIFVQRVAHMLYEMDVPMLPRIMTEHAHSLTGIDIHPGARLGRRFFIDHGTGVVIGETTEIGANVRIYQGVTLGALAPDRLVESFRGRKRHPTIEDDVTIYAGATILGGDTVIGRGCVIGGNVFITTSVPAMNMVSMENPKLRYRERRQRGQDVLDFQI